ncbi:HAD family hydrolase [Sinorhizobium meliloti]|uniref:HAD family hydrolase n=1 Tax=Rhizobium meliloti TaxID=382 RepID=UPI000411BC9F|nr:HAD hydrolase family protein [Sinorhizobium meliloti]UFX13138.1 HAD hydrolase family protein [Sinorhizobium meliloti]
MQGTIFSTKLDALDKTVALIDDVDLSAMAKALSEGARKVGYAIGSGGSLISACFLSACRSDLSEMPTSVQTPMEFVLDDRDLRNSQVWIFSGRGENADAHAAASAAKAWGCKDIQIVTSNPRASIFSILPVEQFTKHVLPVFEEKDGFLSTHSLVAAIAALLGATHKHIHRSDVSTVISEFAEQLRARRTPARITEFTNAFDSIASNDTLIVLADPGMRAAAVALETSLWETAICPVQLTDFRNFAHGRHVWLHKRAAETFVLAITGQQSRSAWIEIEKEFPDTVRRHELAYANAGRIEQAVAVIDALMVVEAAGAKNAIDPGKPGVGTFAKPIYEGTALASIVTGLKAPVRSKLKAIRRAGITEMNWDPVTGYVRFSEGLRSARFHGLVLDYDGTVVSTEARLEPPSPAIIAELERLMDGGLKVAFATGRGGSAGEVLRDHIAATHHGSILMGYYNGGYIRSLSIDIREDPAPEAAAIKEMAEWVAERRYLLKKDPKVSGVQISIAVDGTIDSEMFVSDLKFAPPVVSGAVRTVFSEHSVDIVLPTTSKLNVLSSLSGPLGDDQSNVLCIGDSGGLHGNDFELLGHAHGVSVRDVCHRADMCWSLFDGTISGPDALLQILRSLTQVSAGIFQIDVQKLSLEDASESLKERSDR